MVEAGRKTGTSKPPTAGFRIKRALRPEAFVNCQRRFLTKPSIMKIRFIA